MFKVRFVPALVLALVFVTLAGAEPARKNTYYSQWSNGVPDDSTFFPVAVWTQRPNLAAAYSACGVNLFIALWDGPTSGQLADLKAAGMHTICSQNSVGLNDPNNDMIVGWMRGDEPDLALHGPDCVPTATVRQQYATLRAADATRPVYLNLGLGVAHTSAGSRGSCTGATWMYPEYIEGCDIVSFDIYPVTSTDVIVQGNLWYVPKGIDSLRMWSNYEKPAWCWIECSHIHNPDLMPTPEQTRAQVWMAIVHEASGIGYFCHEWYPSFIEGSWMARYPDMKAMITRTNNEIAAMAPALNSPTIHDAVTAETSWRNRLKTMVKVHGGYTYVYAVFERNRAGDVTFTVNGLSGSGTAEVVGEGRTVSVTDGVFSDSFDKYGCHIYKVTGSAAITIDGGSPFAAARLERTLQVVAPVNRTLVIRKHEDIRGTDLEVVLYAADGTEAARMVSPGNAPVLEYDVTGFTPGLYQAVVRNGDAVVVKPFIVIK